MADVSFVDVLCDFRRHLRYLFMISVLSIVVLLASLVYVDPGSGGYVLAVVQLVSFGVVLVLSGGGMVVCGRRAE
ncbi:hypothetical protein [Candidatus Halobonum tyrrellensis]|uniref:Uncharacterized protein n=1 Tax=Candidatus Halobonum tyrrellensis G22 TaxID=1324957 RepID=V4GNN8_9EURY|nr:hypothetical protein [Candidatus Halobonum tyrrellensis]ESP87006.1 hypothetical protein K933_15842 [Candidatus Halobonum tyrrellensis G22]